MNQILNHKLWGKALKLHKQALSITNNKERKKLLDDSFNLKIIISRELKTPLYDVMLLIISHSR